MIDLIIVMLVSVVFFVIAYLVGQKGKINLIHSHHHKNVKEHDKKAYTKEFEKGMNIIASGLFVNGLLEYFTKIEWLWILYLANMFYGFWIFHKAQMKYNDGKWF